MVWTCDIAQIEKLNPNVIDSIPQDGSTWKTNCTSNNKQGQNPSADDSSLTRVSLDAISLQIRGDLPLKAASKKEITPRRDQ